MWKDGVDDRGNMWLRRRKGGRGPETWVWESLATGLQGVSVTVTRHGKLSALRCLHWGQLMQRHKCQIGLWVLHQEVRIIRGIVAEEFSIRVTFERSPCAFMIKVLQGNRTSGNHIDIDYICKEKKEMLGIELWDCGDGKSEISRTD